MALTDEMALIAAAYQRVFPASEDVAVVLDNLSAFAKSQPDPQSRGGAGDVITHIHYMRSLPRRQARKR